MEGEDQLHVSMDFSSFQTRTTTYADMADPSKKRKLQSVELDLPKAKYKCVESDSNCDTMSLQVDGEALTTDGGHIVDASQVESARDSNSIADDADTAMSACVDVNCGYGHAMGKDIASTSTKWPGCDYPQEMLYSSDGKKELISASSGKNFNVVFGRHVESPHECGLQMRQMLEEQLLEFGVDLTYGCSEYANACQERCTNKEVEDCNLSSGLGSTNYILSSGRNSVNNEPLNSTKRPTIDKEFEEYFSMLMM